MLHKQRTMVHGGRGQTWHQWDNRLFAVLGKHPYSTGAILCVGAIMGWVTVWVGLWKLGAWWKWRSVGERYRVSSVGGKMINQD